MDNVGAWLILKDVERLLVDLSDSPNVLATNLESMLLAYGIVPEYKHEKFWEVKNGGA